MRQLLRVVFCLSICQLGFSQNFDEVEIKSTKVSDHIYMLEGSGGNIAVSVGDDGSLMVDSQYGPLSDKITRKIKEISDGPVKLLVNTHWHGDHTGGNENFGKMGAMIFAHENVKERMSKTQLVRAFSREVPAAPEIARPAITFEDQMSLRCNGEYLLLVHVDNAHTDGDALIYFPQSDVLHMGDTYFNGRYPFIDLSSGGSIDGIIAAVDKALFMISDDTKVIPGHGALSNKAELQDYRNVLKSLRDKVNQLISEGKSLDEIKAIKPGSNTDDAYGTGFISAERFLEILYDSLTNPPPADSK